MIITDSKAMTKDDQYCGRKYMTWMSSLTLQSSWKRIPRVSQSSPLAKFLVEYGFVKILCPDGKCLAAINSDRTLAALRDDFIGASESESVLACISRAVKDICSVVNSPKLIVKKVRRG